jgi:hypothetical protein
MRASGAAPAPVVTRADAVGTWTLVTYTRTAANTHVLRVYNQNGAVGTATETATNGAHADVDVFIGGFAGAAGDSGAGIGFFSGLIDEVSVSNVARDTNWLNLAFESQRPNQLFTNIGAIPLAVPGAPTGVTGTPSTTTTGSISVAWVAPASDGGASITGYTVTANPGGATCATTGALTCTVTGLTGGTGYTFTVTATNSVGTGPASAPSPAVTAPVSVLPGSYAIRVGHYTKPFTFRLPPETGALTENLTMTISDVWGRTVWTRTIRPSERAVRTITWNATTSTGARASAGVYLVRITGEKTPATVQKGVMLKP